MQQQYNVSQQLKKNLIKTIAKAKYIILQNRIFISTKRGINFFKFNEYLFCMYYDSIV